MRKSPSGHRSSCSRCPLAPILAQLGKMATEGFAVGFAGVDRMTKDLALTRVIPLDWIGKFFGSAGVSLRG